MRVLILGDAELNNGPSNVHKALVRHWPTVDEVDYVRSRNKAGFVFEGLRKGLRSDVIVSPCMDMAGIVAQQTLRLFGKPVICFNHGYVPFENDINGLGHGEVWISLYKGALRQADCVVCNSLLQERFVLARQPELEGRTCHILLGIEHFDQRAPRRHKEAVIAVSGGSRAIKGNDTVVRACAKLRGRGVPCRLRLYGDFDQGAEALRGIMDQKYDREMGQVSREMFLDGLSDCSLFVMNSRHEPFGLSAIDAIEAGVPVLISRNCGIDEVLGLEKVDVVDNPEDVSEVAGKMAFLLGHPNARRLYKSIDFGALSWDMQTAKLRQMCADVLNKRGVRRREDD